MLTSYQGPPGGEQTVQRGVTPNLGRCPTPSCWKEEKAPVAGQPPAWTCLLLADLPRGGARQGMGRSVGGGVRTHSLEGNRNREKPPPTSTGRNVEGVGQAQRNWGGAPSSKGASPETSPWTSTCPPPLWRASPCLGVSAEAGVGIGGQGPSLSCRTAFQKALDSWLGREEGRVLAGISPTRLGRGVWVPRPLASGLGRAGLGWATARLTPTLSLCQAQKGQTTLPFSAPGS